jgi:tRNA A37 threonylcarbamoyladenosine dehydratase
MEQHSLSRMRLLTGSEGLQRLQGASVAVFGIGGVGSYAVEALARAGVGTLTLVDFDDICITNINRQIHALSSTVGRSKVDAMAERCQDINPAINVIARKAFYSADTSEELLTQEFDYVLDCIDHITAKLHLIATCKERELPVIASMGAANKLDPTCIKVADLADTTQCRLARTIRRELRKRGIESGVQVVYSTEEFRPLDAESSVCGEDCVCPNRADQVWSCDDRRVILGSSSYIPPIFGLTMAGEVIRALLGEVST